MQVLKNLFGLNKKIAASEIAIKNSNGKGVTLDEFLNTLDVYSTEEQVIGTWIDGKTLYRRTFTGITVNGEYTILTTDYNSNTIKVTKVYGGIQGDYGVQVGCYLNNNYYSGFFTHIDELQLYYGGSLKGKEYNVTIEFTKTTD